MKALLSHRKIKPHAQSCRAGGSKDLYSILLYP